MRSACMVYTREDRRHAVVPLSAERVVPNWSQAPAALSSRDRLLAKPLAAPFRLHGRYEPCRRCGCCICWSLPTALIIDGAERVWPYERACRPQGNRKGKSTVSWRQLSPLHFIRRGSDQGVPCVGQQ